MVWLIDHRSQIKGNATIDDLTVTNNDSNSIRIGSGSSGESICQELSNKNFDQKKNTPTEKKIKLPLC